MSQLLEKGEREREREREETEEQEERVSVKCTYAGLRVDVMCVMHCVLLCVFISMTSVWV